MIRLPLIAIAEDRYSQRRKDVDGRLHVAACNISKANVCPYLGREIPEYEALGLDANRIYNLYRDPGELARGAESFERLQLLEIHQVVHSDAPGTEVTVGTLANVAFDAGYLRADLTVWDGGAIKRVEARELAQISCGYRYRADMKAGTTPEGVAFDGVMRDIIGNHVALVRIGRAGPDVVVADEILPEQVPMTFKRSRIVAALAGLCNIKLDTATPEQKAQLAALDEATDAELLALAPPAIDPNAPKAITQDQLDAAVATAVEATRTSERARTTALDQAITDVEPLVGTVSGMDSAEAVYRFALDKAQVPDSATLPAAALPSLVALAIKAKAPAAAPLANDEAPATLAGCFPSVGAIRRLG